MCGMIELYYSETSSEEVFPMVDNDYYLLLLMANVNDDHYYWLLYYSILLLGQYSMTDEDRIIND